MAARIILLAASLVLLRGAATAQIPQTMHYQGRVSDSTGVPLEGAHALVLSLYNQEAGGSPLWAESLNVELVAGVFSVTLGTISPLNLPFDEPYWLATSVDGGPELSPRIALAASPYSLNAHSNVAEPQPGQDFLVRDSSGATTHTLFAQGGASFTGGIVIDGLNDTALVVRSALGIAMMVVAGDSIPSGILDSVASSSRQPGSLQTTSAERGSENVGLIGAGDKIGVHGVATDGPGVKGQSIDGDGVQGKARGPGNGVVGEADGGIGVKGRANDGDGMRGESDMGDGVSGKSLQGAGGSFESLGDVGIRAKGPTAGEFKGDVKVKGEVYAQSIHVVRLDSNFNIVDTFVNFNADGTSEHFGLETYYDGIKIVPDSGSARSVLIDPSDSTPALQVNTPAGDTALRVGGRAELLGEQTSVYGGLEAVRQPSGSWALTLDSVLALFRARQATKNDSGRTVHEVDPNPQDGSPVLNVNGGTMVNDYFCVQPEGAAYPTVHVTDRVDVVGPVSIGKDTTYPQQVIIDPLASPSAYQVKVRGRTSMVSDTSSIGSTLAAFKSASMSAAMMEDEAAFAERVLGSVPAAPTLDRTVPRAAAAGLLILPVIQAFTDLAEGSGIQALNVNAANIEAALEGINTGGGAGLLGRVANAGSAYPGVWAATTGQGSALLVDHQGSAGDLATLRDAGVNQARIDKTGKGFFNGGTQTGGADIAEAFAVEGRITSYAPGDVMAISTTDDRTAALASEPYSRLVVGVYATRPGVLLTERHIDESLEGMIPVGVIGVLPTRVTTENGPIRRGDMLVASGTPGHAMRGTDWERMHGATIGKALEEFDGPGSGLIRVLVNVK